MGFLKQGKFQILLVVIFIFAFILIRNHFSDNEDFNKRVIENRKEESYSGVIQAKYIDSSDHCIPKLVLTIGTIPMDNFFWKKLKVGDSIVKLKNDLTIAVFTKNDTNYILDYENHSYFKSTNSSMLRQYGLLNDFEKIFNKDQEKEISDILFSFNSKSKNKILIVSVASYEPYDDFQEFTTQLGNRWHIEQNNEGRTILIVISKEKRKIGLTMGSGVSDLYIVEIKKIISDNLVPLFKEDRYYDGTKKTLLEISKVWY